MGLENCKVQNYSRLGGDQRKGRESEVAAILDPPAASLAMERNTHTHHRRQRERIRRAEEAAPFPTPQAQSTTP
jgi:hypothetical protein